MFLHHLANRLIVFDENIVFVFEGTYQEFLDRVGWEEESQKPKKNKKTTVSQAQQRSSEAEEARRKKKLSETIAASEKVIDEKEALLEEVNVKLAEAYKNPDAEKIKDLQIESHRHVQELEQGYAELEGLIAELDKHNT
jgi:ATP-binding cassette, subfamily F, member 3